jgi:hypothetical protein
MCHVAGDLARHGRMLGPALEGYVLYCHTVSRMSALLLICFYYHKNRLISDLTIGHYRFREEAIDITVLDTYVSSIPVFSTWKYNVEDTEVEAD